MKRALIADNHPLMRDAIRSLLEEQPGFTVVGDVSDAEACLFQIDLIQPDIVILDLNMPGGGGFHVLAELQRQQATVQSYVLSMYSGREFVRRAQELGARGFVAKEDVGQEFIAILRAEGAGFAMSSSAGTSSAEEARFPVPGDAPRDLSVLTHTERKVLVLLAEAKSSDEISEVLGVSPRTIHTHRQNIRQKLDLRGANSLVTFAAAHKSQIISG